MLARKSELEHNNKIIIADNYYASPHLCALLAMKGIGFIGTCQLIRKHVPSSLLKFQERTPNIVQGSTKIATVTLNAVYATLTAIPMYCLSWYDTKFATFIATAGGVETMHVIHRNRDGSEKNVPAPVIVKTYTERIGAVGLADKNKQRDSVAAAVVTRKWWFRIFQGLLDIAVTNS